MKFIRFNILLIIISMFMIITSCNESTLDDIASDPLASNKAINANNDLTASYIVVYKEEALLSREGMSKKNYANNSLLIRNAVRSHLGTRGVEPEVLDQVYSSVFEGFTARLSARDVDILRTDEKIKYIEKDRIVSLVLPQAGKGRKPPKDGGGEEPPPPQQTPYGINRVGGATDATGKTAWIIDTGIDYDHPDLNVDKTRARTFVTFGKDAKNADDNNGHGTHCAGIVGAKDNNEGVVGVAANATVVPVKVLDFKGSGYYSSVIAGIDYVSNMGSPGDVANLSLGGPVSQAVDDAVAAAAAKGIFFAIAAGNDADDANNYTPARTNGANIYTISAMDANDIFAGFSNYSNPPVDFCAPGVSILSTWKGGVYNTISGTSMAAPHAAGVLLITNGMPSSDGYVINDPDNNPDLIISK